MTKEEYEDFALRYKGCGACFPMYHTLSRFEKIWFTAIQKDIAELEDKLANADYQLEGRDNEIRELTEQIEELKCCANCKYEEQGYMVEPCKSCNRYFPTLKVGARDKWERR